MKTIEAKDLPHDVRENLVLQLLSMWTFTGKEGPTLEAATSLMNQALDSDPPTGPAFIQSESGTVQIASRFEDLLVAIRALDPSAVPV